MTKDRDEAFGHPKAKLRDPYKYDEFGVIVPKDSIMIGDKLIKLNDGQLEALKLGKAFLDNADSHFFCIMGSAGSGKTTMAKAILQGNYNVIVTAPTHKAKKVVSYSTGYKGETIQKILGMQPNMALEDFSQTNVLFSLTGKCLLDSYKIVLIDEASMLPTDIVELIKLKAIEHDVKVIFMGDPRQLPPVKEKISKVFIDPDIERFMLTTVERQQAGDPTINLYSKVLNRIDDVDDIVARLKELEVEAFSVENDQAATKLKIRLEHLEDEPFELIDEITPEGIGHQFFNNNKDFGAKIKDYFQIGKDLNNRIVAYKNETVGAYNSSVRKMLLGDHKLPVQEGEFLMAYGTVTDANNWSHTIYENSADYMVKSITAGYQVATNHNKSKTKDIAGWWVKISDIDNERGVEKIFVVSRESYSDFIDIAKEYIDYAEKVKGKFAWKQYYIFKNQFVLMDDIMRADNQKKKLIPKDFDFGYAITIYKSQGSTYDNVFVVSDDINSNHNLQERFRLEYVALSRKQKGAYILNSKS